MSDNDLSRQYQDLYTLIKSGGKIAFQLASTTIWLAVNTALFILSCGSLVRWRPQLNQGNNPQTVKKPEESKLEVKSEENHGQVPRTPSRDTMIDLLENNEIIRKASWALRTRESEDVIVVPSLSLPRTELEKVPGALNYEERLLCYLFYLVNPKLKLVYATSMPIEKSIIDYYLALLEQSSLITVEEAKKRLLLISCNDSGLTPLSSKLLRRPKLLQKIKNFIDPKKAYVCCYISSNLERKLALELGVPLFANDPSLNYWGTKSGSREVFEKSGVLFPKGSNLLWSIEELSQTIAKIFIEENYNVSQFIVKLDVGFSGRGNSIIKTKYFDKNNLVDSITEALSLHLEFTCEGEDWQSFVEKVKIHGVIVEVWVDDAISSPSCQAIINPMGVVEILSTHEQMLDGMIYKGCIFPAKPGYRTILIENTLKIGKILSERGCRERFAIDYVVKKENENYTIFAIEINVRWGGTSHPMMTAKYLTSAELSENGVLVGCDDQNKYYVATDSIQSDVYTGLTPTCFIDFINSQPDLQFDSENLTGVVFHLFSTISEFGNFGFVAIANSPEEANELYDKTVKKLEEEATEVSLKKQFHELDMHIIHPSNK